MSCIKSLRDLLKGCSGWGTISQREEPGILAGVFVWLGRLRRSSFVRIWVGGVNRVSYFVKEVQTLIAVGLGWVVKEYYSVVYIRSGLNRYRFVSKEVLS